MTACTDDLDLDARLRRRARIATLAALLGCGLSPAAIAQAVALVTDRNGTVTSGEAAEGKPVAVLAALPSGARLRLEPGATVTLFYVQSGDQFLLTGPGQAEIRAAAPEFDPKRIQRRPAAQGAALRLQVSNVAMGGTVMRSMSPVPKLRFPAGLLTRAPDRFAWDSSRPEASYRVELREETGRVLLDETAKGAGLAFPRRIVLAPGQRYVWTGRQAGDDAAVSAEQTFELAPEALRSEASRRRPPNAAAFADRLVYTLWLEQVGAAGEAREGWNGLARERPEEPSVLARAQR